MQLQYQQDAHMYIKNSYIHADLLQPCGHTQVKYKGWLRWICADWLWNLTDLNFCVIILFITSPMTVTWLVETCRKSLCIKLFVKYLFAFFWYYYIYNYMILCWQQPSSSPYPDAYQSTPLQPLCLRSILILYRHPRQGVPWGLCPSSFPTKTLRAFPFCIVCATCPTHPVSLNLICAWIDLAQDEDSLRALVNAVMDF
jgi:hypothetical protein